MLTARPKGKARNTSEPMRKKPKMTDEVCMTYNEGRCNTLPCPNGFVHRCSHCGGKHPEKFCPMLVEPTDPPRASDKKDKKKGKGRGRGSKASY